jgi:hypothetical protein
MGSMQRKSEKERQVKFGVTDRPLLEVALEENPSNRQTPNLSDTSEVCYGNG